MVTQQRFIKVKFIVPHIQIYLMDQESVRNIVARANMALSPDIISRVVRFLNEEIGVTSENMNYEVFAALGIVGEVAELKTVDSSRPVSCGIPLQMVLRHSVGLSKESLLQVVVRQCNKWRDAPRWLGVKIDDVKLAYRMFKKYRAIFEALAGRHCIMEKQSLFNLMAIFWVVFLFVKNSSKTESDTIETTTILYSLFRFVFGEVITQLPETEISSHFKSQFKECQIPSEEQYENYRARMFFQLQSIHEWRHRDQSEINLQVLATNENVMQRFLDDISNHYDKFKLTLKKHTVDESSFLQLDKTLTPQSMVRQHGVPEAAICKKMNFLDDDDDENEEQPPIESEPPSRSQSMVAEPAHVAPRMAGLVQRMQPLSPLARHYQHQATPLTARHQNLAWVNKITSKMYEKGSEEIRQIYQQGTSNSYDEYESQAMEKILQSINEFTPSCMDFNKRKHSVYTFFLYFIRKIYDQHNQEERKAIFKSKTSFDSILCLSANLFNFAYQSLQSSYRQYCHIFGISIIQGLIPINWFGINVDMPKSIEGFLYDLEKKILIQQIWQSGEGFDVLINSAKKYRGQAILKRLRLHADERAQQLCESMKVDDKQITKIVNLVRFILERRQTLLKENKIDQIIVCSIGAILSINRSRNFSLQEIFNHYNRMLYSLNISRSIFYDQQGKEVDLLDYYNHVFLEQVDQIISNEEQARNVLDTPIRLQRKKSLDLGMEMTPLKVKFKQVAIGAFGVKRVKSDTEEKGPANYRNHLVHSLKNLNIREQAEEHENQQQEDLPSPCFGGSLHRTISFGDFGEKF